MSMTLHVYFDDEQMHAVLRSDSEPGFVQSVANWDGGLVIHARNVDDDEDLMLPLVVQPYSGTVTGAPKNTIRIDI